MLKYPDIVQKTEHSLELIGDSASIQKCRAGECTSEIFSDKLFQEVRKLQFSSFPESMIARADQ